MHMFPAAVISWCARDVRLTTPAIYFSVAPRAASAPHEITYGALPWGELVTGLLATYDFRDDKTRGPMISPATFTPGARKSEDNVTGVHWLMLDYDDVTPADFLNVLGRLESEGIAAFCYTTWQAPEATRKTAPDGTMGLIRARVGMPISRPCSPQEWRGVYGAAVAKYGASGLDTSCSDPSRFYFTPSLPRGAEWAASTWRASGAGFVDIDTLAKQFGGLVSVGSARAMSSGTDPIPRDALHKIAIKWGRSSKTEELRASQMLRSALDGHAFAVRGQRHSAKLSLSMRIAAVFPHGNAAQISEYFRQSFDLMRDGSEREDPVDKFTGLLESAQQKVVADAQACTEQARLFAQTNIVKAWQSIGVDRDTPYTSEELSAAATALGLQHPSELASRWLVQRGDWIHTLCIDPKLGPRYLPPESRSAVLTSVAQNLSPASTAGFSSYMLAKDGTTIPKPLERLVSEYGRVVSFEEMSLIAPASYLDAKRSCLVQASAPLAKIDPEYDEEVDEWLALLAGDANPTVGASRSPRGTKAARLADWLAVVTDLSKPAPAIYFKGGAGAGKTMFAEGLARLWGQDSPTSLHNVIGNFNAAIARCPLILGDEKIPETFRGEPRTEELRELITKTNFELNRKNRDIVMLKGSLRILLCANNFNMITRKGEFSPEDAQALADRFILLTPHPMSAAYCTAKGARLWGETMVDGLRIAKHVHWLRAHHEAGIRPIERGPRLYVPGDASLLTDVLQTATRTPWAICFWLWSFLKNPALHVSASTGRPLAAIVTSSDGAPGAQGVPSLWASSEHIVQAWDHYLQGERVPSRELVMAAMRNVTDPRGTGARLRRTTRAPVHGSGVGTRVEYHRVRIEAIVQWATQQGEDTSAVGEWLAVDTERLGMPGAHAPGPRPN